MIDRSQVLVYMPLRGIVVSLDEAKAICHPAEPYTLMPPRQDPVSAEQAPSSRPENGADGRDEPLLARQLRRWKTRRRRSGSA